MKLEILKKPEYTEAKVTVEYSGESDRINSLLDMLRIYCRSLPAQKSGGQCNLELDKIYYFESVDEKTYIYTRDDVFDCKYKLYTLEEMLRETSFIRVSKNCILNTARLKSVRPFVNGKFEATMMNDEKIIINRHYVVEFKKKFGL